MAFTVDNAFLTVFDPIFQELIKRPEGSKLMNLVTQYPMSGDTQYIRQYEVGRARWRSEAAQKTDYTSVKYDRRRARPVPLDLPIMFDDVDNVRIGTPPIQQIAMRAAAECGILIDGKIVEGMTKDTETENGLAKLTNANKIAWDSAPYGTDAKQAIANSLNTYKCAQAIARMDKRDCIGAKICVASSFALTSLRVDERAANRDFNVQPAMATKMNTAFAGVDLFVSYENMPKWTVSVGGNAPAAGTTKEYAIVYDTSAIYLASNMPLTMKNGTDANKYLNDLIIYTGMYDCVRLYESAVQLIEVVLPAGI